MPDKITIRINVKPTDDPNDPPDAKQTVSQFSIEPKGHVTFTNDATAQAKVVFVNPSPLCAANGDQIPELSLATSGPTQSQKNKVCDTAAGLYKYTATVTGAAEEDPIFIVEKSRPGELDKKPIFFPEGIPMLLIGALVGAIIGYLVAKRLLTRNPRPT